MTIRGLLSKLAGVLTLAVLTMGSAFAAATDLQQGVLKQIDSPDAASTTGNYLPKALVEASTDKTTATLSMAKALPFASDVWLVNTAFTVKAPFDSSKDNVVDLGSLSGLTAGTNARLEIGGLYWPPFPAASEKDFDVVCSDYIGRVLPGYYWSRDQKDPRPKEQNLGQPTIGKSCYDILTTDGLRAALKVLNDAAAAAAKKQNQSVPKEIAPIAGSDPILAEGYKKLTDINARGFSYAQGFVLAVTANRQKFSYASSAAPTQVTDETKTGSGVSLNYNFILNSWVLAIGASYEKSYKGAKEVQICSPIGSTGSTQCASGALKAPTESTNKLIFAEFRSALGTNIALSPRIEYKTDTSDLGISLPIYLAKNEKRVLDGGISLGWTKADHFTASVFIGKAFGFFD